MSYDGTVVSLMIYFLVLDCALRILVNKLSEHFNMSVNCVTKIVIVDCACIFYVFDQYFPCACNLPQSIIFGTWMTDPQIVVVGPS